MRKKLITIALTLSVLASCSGTPALAFTEDNEVGGTITITSNTGNETEQTTSETAETEEPVIDRSSVEEENGTSESEEASEDENLVLTPDGNMTLVDDMTVSSGSKQFITLTTRDGNYYYLIIDHTKDGGENVHFLNQVDERDLIGLMDEKEAEELEEELARKKEEEEAAQATQAVSSSSVEEPQSEPTPAPAPEKYFEIAGYRISQKTLMLAATGLVIFIILIALAVRSRKKKHAETNKPDPDVDYDEDEYILAEEDEDSEE